MNKVWELANSLLPVFMTAVIAFGAWVTSDVYALKYSALTAEDGRRIKYEIIESYDDQYAKILFEINRLRDSVDELKQGQAETLTEIKNLKERQDSH